jgi:hypothetical protein
LPTPASLPLTEMLHTVVWAEASWLAAAMAMTWENFMLMGGRRWFFGKDGWLEENVEMEEFE